MLNIFGQLYVCASSTVRREKRLFTCTCTCEYSKTCWQEDATNSRLKEPGHVTFSLYSVSHPKALISPASAPTRYVQSRVTSAYGDIDIDLSKFPSGDRPR